MRFLIADKVYCSGPTGKTFNDQAKGVQIAIADTAESADHLVDPEHALRVAMARQ